MKNKYDEVEKGSVFERAFGKKLSAEVEKRISGQYTKVVKAVTRFLKNKFSSSIFDGDYEEIGSNAALYTLAYILVTQGRLSENIQEWTSAACWKAKLLVLDVLRSNAHKNEALLLDVPFKNGVGEILDDGLIMNRASMEYYRESQLNEAHLERVGRVRRAIKNFLSESCSPRMAQVYWARVMDERSMEDVCKSFKMTPGAVSVAVNRVEKKWKDKGRGYYDAA
ncbi:MAG: hypothetical protein MJ249_02035 [Kiritimatiellae bacterium]|nr:hypothetical protein [Kiritimatiellia bacterium]